MYALISNLIRLSLKYQRAQHSNPLGCAITEQANESRLVTAVRWKVEYINGKIKQFQLLNRERSNSTLKFKIDHPIIKLIKKLNQN